MKNKGKILSILFISAILAINLFVFTSSTYGRNSAVWFDTFLLAEMAESAIECADCNIGGGEGATHCECTGVLLQTERSCAVTVGPGYYACCRVNVWDRCMCPSCPNGIYN
jgi:hypothetical protein